MDRLSRVAKVLIGERHDVTVQVGRRRLRRVSSGWIQLDSVLAAFKRQDDFGYILSPRTPGIRTKAHGQALRCSGWFQRFSATKVYYRSPTAIATKIPEESSYTISMNVQSGDDEGETTKECFNWRDLTVQADQVRCDCGDDDASAGHR